MSEKLKSSDERAEKLRKKLLELKDEEIAKIGRGEEADSDLLAFHSEWIGGLRPKELDMLGSILALERGAAGGYDFGKDEILSIKKAIQEFDDILVSHKAHLLAEEMDKNRGEVVSQGTKRVLSDVAMQKFEQKFNREDYIALYHRWLKRRFEKFFRDHPEYNYAAEAADAMK